MSWARRDLTHTELWFLRKKEWSQTGHLHHNYFAHMLVSCPEDFRARTLTLLRAQCPSKPRPTIPSSTAWAKTLSEAQGAPTVILALEFNIPVWQVQKSGSNGLSQSRKIRQRTLGWHVCRTNCPENMFDFQDEASYRKFERNVTETSPIILSRV